MINKYTQVITLKSLPSLLLLIAVLAGCQPANTNKISLEGRWHVRLDSTSIGKDEKWASENFAETTITLPGTLDDAGLGAENTLEPAINNYVLSHLARKHQYIGKAWYQREIEIPENWKNKMLTLTLERVIWESQVYVDGQKAGMEESLIAPHRYDLTELLTPGKHVITIMVDNSNKYPAINVAGSKYPDPVSQDMAHAYTNHTQIKWNGIIGELSLTAENKVYVEDAQVYPDVDSEQLSVQLKLNNYSPTAWNGHVAYSIVDKAGNDVLAGKQKVNITGPGETLQFNIATEGKLKFWDEFNPELYTFQYALESETGEIHGSPSQVSFGFREIANEEGVLTLNNQRIFLRGNLECAIFPLTGYPYTEKSDWRKMIDTAKAYGLNHLRFHSWCPPAAAFEAADEAGFYLQVELPHWSLKVGEDEATNKFLANEADLLLKEYGNHPSFVLFSLGNELQGDSTLLNNMIRRLKEKDNRHLYATTTFSFQKGMGTYPLSQDEYFVTQYTDKGWIRGQGIFNARPPHFNKDYSAAIDHIGVPVISHEIGQYSVYPDMSEIEKYTGVLQPLNFIAVRNELEKNGLIDLADEFTRASGKLATLLYKEEIERALKTEGFDGFQLLQLQDFPGQGTALVGLLNAFWESKGFITPEEFREFCSEIVPLIEFEKAVYTRGETFEATVEVANFFEERNNAALVWKIADEKGNQLAGGEFGDLTLAIGNNKNIGKIEFPIEVKEAKRLTISVALKDTPYQNQWSIWVYPENVSVTSDEVLVTSDFKEAEKALKEGKSVLLNPPLEAIKGIKGRFVPVFWSPVHFPDQPGTMGMLCDPQHPALADFPTDFHSNWQWWDLAIQSKSLIVDSLDVKPIVRVIDNFVTNHHLANLFEVKVGDGKLLFSSIDLTNNLDSRPVASQLLHSLLSYMESDGFNPTRQLEFEELKKQISNQ